MAIGKVNVGGGGNLDLQVKIKITIDQNAPSGPLQGDIWIKDTPAVGAGLYFVTPSSTIGGVTGDYFIFIASHQERHKFPKTMTAFGLAQQEYTYNLGFARFDPAPANSLLSVEGNSENYGVVLGIQKRASSTKLVQLNTYVYSNGGWKQLSDVTKPLIVVLQGNSTAITQMVQYDPSDFSVISKVVDSTGNQNIELTLGDGYGVIFPDHDFIFDWISTTRFKKKAIARDGTVTLIWDKTSLPASSAPLYGFRNNAGQVRFLGMGSTVGVGLPYTLLDADLNVVASKDLYTGATSLNTHWMKYGGVAHYNHADGLLYILVPTAYNTTSSLYTYAINAYDDNLNLVKTLGTFTCYLLGSNGNDGVSSYVDNGILYIAYASTTATTGFKFMAYRLSDGVKLFDFLHGVQMNRIQVKGDVVVASKYATTSGTTYATTASTLNIYKLNADKTAMDLLTTFTYPQWDDANYNYDGQGQGLMIFNDRILIISNAATTWANLKDYYLLADPTQGGNFAERLRRTDVTAPTSSTSSYYEGKIYYNKGIY